LAAQAPIAPNRQPASPKTTLPASGLQMTKGPKSWVEKAIAITQIVANLAVAGSLIFAGMQLLDMRRASYQEGRFHSWLDLFHSFDEINNYIAQHSNKPPLYPEFRSNQHTSTLLFHHLNLAFRAWLYHNIGTISDDEFAGFQNWTDKILFSWLEKESCVAFDMNTILTIGDLYPSAFLKWFRALPGYARAVRQASACQGPIDKK
jgi:hypothetical protein